MSDLPQEPSASIQQPSSTSDPQNDAVENVVKSRGTDDAVRALSRVRRRVSREWSRLGIVAGHQVARMLRDDHVFLILMAALVGVASGAAAGTLLIWIEAANAWFPKVDNESSLRWLVMLGVPVAGGLLVGLLRHVATRSMGLQLVSGVSGVIATVSGAKKRLRGGGGLVVGAGTGLTIGSGGSVGHEGPTIAIGATAGAVVARFFGLRQRRQTVMIGAGSAAGLAAAFNAPLSGVIFTVEVVFGRAVGGQIGTMSIFAPLIVAAVAGTFTSHAIFGERPEFMVSMSGGGSLHELPFHVLVAVLAGVLSPGMGKSIFFFRKAFDRLAVPEWVKPGIGGLGVGLLGALAFTDLLGPGRETIGQALQNELVWQIALPLLGLKIVAMSLTIGSRGFGSFFLPSLFLGACIGTLVHAVAAIILGDSVGTASAYALVGMGAFLGATLRAPVTSIIMIFELTQDYGLILPVMVACLLASFIAGRLQPESLYEQTLAYDGVSIRSGREDEKEVMKKGRVADLVIADARSVRPDDVLKEVRAGTRISDDITRYVVNDENRVIAVFDTRDLLGRLLSGDICEQDQVSSVMLSGTPPLLYKEDTLAGAMVAFSECDYDVLPVVSHDGSVVGIIRRVDLIAHYSARVLSAQEEALQIAGGKSGPDQEVGLGKGIILDRVVVGSSWEGKTLAQLDLRGRAQVQVLEWQRTEELLPIDPKRPLVVGDILAVAGTRQQLLKLRWLG